MRGMSHAPGMPEPRLVVVVGRGSVEKDHMRGLSLLRSPDGGWPRLSCGSFWGCDLYNNLFCPEPGPDLVGKIFSNLAGTHEFHGNFWRDIKKLVNKAILKFDLQDLCAVIISHRAQNTGLDGLSFQEYHHSPTCALES